MFFYSLPYTPSKQENFTVALPVLSVDIKVLINPL
jgi:hypothetical protein